MPETLRATASNQLLASLSPPDLARLKPHLKSVSLPVRMELEKPNKPIETIFFVHSGIASVVAFQPNGQRVEIGLIGREGVSGSSVLLGDGQPPHSTYIQVTGEGEQISANELRRALAESSTLHTLLLKYAHSFAIQTAHTAIANARAKLSERLARWLLMAQDRIEGNVLALTH